MSVTASQASASLSSRLVKHKLTRFVVIGVANNLVGYATFVVLSLLGVSAIPAMSVSYGMGMVISFTGNRKWTFSHRGSVGRALGRFLIANAVGYGLNFGLLWIFVKSLGLPQIPVQFFATGCVALCTFLMMRLWVFRSERGDAVA